MHEVIDAPRDWDEQPGGGVDQTGRRKLWLKSEAMPSKIFQLPGLNFDAYLARGKADKGFKGLK